MGYNIFSDNTFTGSVSTDQLGVDSAMLNLGPLQVNGGTTPTMQPLMGSVAIDKGDSSDLSPAQDTLILDGRRDVGASENWKITSNISELEDINNIRIYPNPNNGQFTIELDDYFDKKIKIYDIQGRLVYQDIINTNRSIINLDGIENGVYILRVVSDNNREFGVARIVLQR